jgi:hypothetical protein
MMTDPLSLTEDQLTNRKQRHGDTGAKNKHIKIGRRGSDLAIRIPKHLVEKYNLKVGDTINGELFSAELARGEIKRAETK